MAGKYTIRGATVEDMENVQQLADAVRSALMEALPIGGPRLETSLIVYGLLVVAAELTAKCPQHARGFTIETFQRFYAEAVKDYVEGGSDGGD